MTGIDRHLRMDLPRHITAVVEIMPKRELHIIDARPGIMHMIMVHRRICHIGIDLLERSTQADLHQDTAVLVFIQEMKPRSPAAGQESRIRHVVHKRTVTAFHREPEQMVCTGILRLMQAPEDIHLVLHILRRKLTQLLQTIFPSFGGHEASLCPK